MRNFSSNGTNIPYWKLHPQKLNYPSITLALGSSTFQVELKNGSMKTLYSIHYVQYSDLTFFNYYHENHTKLYFHKFLAHLTQRVMWAIVTTERPSVVRPSVNFSHFNQLLWSHWANLNQTLVEWSLDGPLPNFVRWSRLPTKMAAKLKIEKGGMKF